MLSHADLIDFFDYQKPTLSEILRRYKIVDLNEYPKITNENILYAIITLRPNQAIVLPENYGRRLLEVPNQDLDKYSPKTRHLVHWRYAPDVRLNSTEMSLEEATKQKFTLSSAIRNAEWDSNIPHRGFGVVDVRTHEYTLWPFLYLIEGIKMRDLSPQLIRRQTSTGFDVVGTVPSLEEEKYHTVTLKNVPYLSSEPYVLGTQLHCVCDCEWGHYGARRVDTRRYVGGERMMCRHGIALYKHLINENGVLDFLPQLTGIMNLWYTLKQRTIIDDQRPTKTRMNVLLGMIIAYMTTQKAFG